MTDADITTTSAAANTIADTHRSCVAGWDVSYPARAFVPAFLPTRQKNGFPFHLFH